MKKINLLLTLFIITFSVFAQNTKYDRSSVSVVLTGNHSNYANTMDKALSAKKMSDKFFYNRVLNNVLSPTDKTGISSALHTNRVAAYSLDSWRNVETLNARARYNLTDNEVNQLKASVNGIEGVKEERWFKQLLKNNYILVLDVEKVYDIKSATSAMNILNTTVNLLQGAAINNDYYLEGYGADVHAYLYRIVMDDMDYAFLMDSWSNDSKHHNHDYKIELVNDANMKVDGSQLKGEGGNLEVRLMAAAVDQTLEKFSLVESTLAASSAIIATNPVRARIGRKEGLYPDQPVFVYQAKSKNGKVNFKKTGVLKVASVANNSRNASGNTKPSTFYKAHWGSYQEGMVLVPKRSSGMTLWAGTSLSPYKSFKVGWGMNGSSAARNASAFRKTKIIASLAYSNEMVDENPLFEYMAKKTGKDTYLEAAQLNTFSMGVGLLKEIYLLPGLQLDPYFMINLEYSYYKNEDLVDQIMGMDELPGIFYGTIACPEVGIRMPINLTYNVKLVPAVSYVYRFNNMSTGVGSSSSAEQCPDNVSYIKKSSEPNFELMLQFDF